MIPEEDTRREDNGYKIQIGREYEVEKTEYSGKNYYKIKFTRRQQNGDILEGYKNVKFYSQTLDNDIPDHAIVIPKTMFEDFYYSKGDIRHYNAIWIVVITDWEIKENEKYNTVEAYSDFNSELEARSGVDLPF